VHFAEVEDSIQRVVDLLTSRIHKCCLQAATRKQTYTDRGRRDTVSWALGGEIRLGDLASLSDKCICIIENCFTKEYNEDKR